MATPRRHGVEFAGPRGEPPEANGSRVNMVAFSKTSLASIGRNLIPVAVAGMGVIWPADRSVLASDETGPAFHRSRIIVKMNSGYELREAGPTDPAVAALSARVGAWEHKRLFAPTAKRSNPAAFWALGLDRYYEITLRSPAPDIAAVARLYAELESVELAEPDGRGRGSGTRLPGPGPAHPRGDECGSAAPHRGTPNDPKFDLQYWAHNDGSFDAQGDFAGTAKVGADAQAQGRAVWVARSHWAGARYGPRGLDGT